MSLIYPDNENRANRVAGLAEEIAIIQQGVMDAMDRMDRQRSDISQTMDRILKQNGLLTIAGMERQLMAIMSQAEWANYKANVAEIRGHDATVDKMLQASTLVACLCGMANVFVRPLATIISTGALSAATQLLGRGFVMMIRGEEEAGAVIGAAIRTGVRLVQGGQLSEEAATFVRCFRTAATVLGILGFALDAIIIGIQIIEGEQQRTKLREATTSLFCRRFQAKQLEDSIFATESHNGSIQGILTTYDLVSSSTTKEAKQFAKEILGNLTTSLVDGVKSDLAAITNNSVWAQLVTLDKMGGSWNNEDPKTVSAVVAWLNTQPAIR